MQSYVTETASGSDRPGYAVVPTAGVRRAEAKQSGRLRTQAGRYRSRF